MIEEGFKLPSSSTGRKVRAPPLDKQPQCVFQVRASAKLLSRPTWKDGGHPARGQGHFCSHSPAAVEGEEGR